MQDLVAGQIDMMFENVVLLLQVACRHHQGVCDIGEGPLGSSVDLPTADEAGLRGFSVCSGTALWVPKGTPKDIIAKLNGAVVEGLSMRSKA